LFFDDLNTFRPWFSIIELFLNVFPGLGFSMICATFILSIYYNVILAWAIFYTFAGFQSGLKD
jgi:SNF family Na+-dependent transporter